MVDIVEQWSSLQGSIVLNQLNYKYAWVGLPKQLHTGQTLVLQNVKYHRYYVFLRTPREIFRSPLSNNITINHPKAKEQHSKRVTPS
jgi:hypothetical protein